MTITPDTKNWTWVTERTCPECGFNAAEFPREGVSALLRANAAAWQEVLAGDPEALRLRPDPQTWSPLEYGCHVRDTCGIYLYRLNLMLTQDNPAYPNWDQDATAVEENYGEQDPAIVAGELAEVAEALAARFAEVDGTDWERPGRRSDGSSFTIETFARYFIHDPVHHYWDVTATRAT